jgi:hypothetical protein
MEGRTVGGVAAVGKVDYREVLSAQDFAVFSKLREVRKGLAEKEGVPPYTIFTNEQLAAVVRQKVTTKAEARGARPEAVPASVPSRSETLGQSRWPRPALVTAERPLQRTFGAGQSPVVDHPRLALREWSRGSSSIKIGTVHAFSLIQTWNKSSVISL